MNGTYNIPFLYSLSHYIVGYLGYYNINLLILFIIYQLYQYSIDARFFFLSSNHKTHNIIKKGNSLMHTLKKIAECAVGFLIAYLLHKQL